ncbi:SGNH/GDSL hydrolase family protein [Rhodobacter sp. NTK016B]|uniref:SGNH/GDSL hydrolase family protein n=1 Tax=Rhodobacter sp. NTK016B TaxID=2759676 RepID=UPI001A90B7D4|nr:SGNH/GDSL hydrolase family protein [Rhodobacter sp. NTK016B]MBN8294900.1 SGNH/GDSL hydrolase family protein [Rhodobacter sp. NTK016B]
MTDACTVSGVLYDAGGELLTSTQLVFTRLGKLAALEAETAVAPVFGTGARKTVTTNATTAAFSIDLMPGSWSVTYQGVTGQQTISFPVPVAASADFAVIIDQTNAEGSAIVESYAAHLASTSNPHSVTKAQVGLGDVDNTSDANKPVSTAQAEADALRLAKAQNLADLENAATARGNLGVGNVDNTSDADKPVSTAQQAEFDSLDARVAPFEGGGGPSSGFGAAGLLVDTVYDEDGAPNTGTDAQGLRAWFGGDRLWHGNAAVVTGPAVGWLDDATGGLAQTVTVDDAGALIAAQGEGTDWLSVDFVQAGGVLTRRETAIDAAMPQQTSTEILLPEARVRWGGGWIAVAPRAITSATPAAVSVTGEALSLTDETERMLDYQALSDITVTRDSDSAVLDEGVHYRVDREIGAVVGLVDTAAFACTVDYTGYLGRCDLVSLNPITRAVTVTLGTERKRSIEMFEAALPEGDIALFRFHRHRLGADVQPVFQFNGLIQLNREPDIAADIALQRRRARPHRELVRTLTAASAAVKLGGYADSITQMGSKSDIAFLNANPNGPERDKIGYFELQDSSARALITTYDFGDGQGSTHVKEGWNWRIAAHLENVYGATVDYRNWGVGGTFSADTTNSDGAQNMLHPDRLAALLADDCHIVNIATGMNELGETFTYANVRAICEALLSDGSLVMITQPVRPNERFRERIDWWRETCAQLEQVGHDLDLPVIKTTRLFDPTRLGGLGMGEYLLAGASLKNHPGVKELAAVGNLCVEIF